MGRPANVPALTCGRKRNERDDDADAASRAGDPKGSPREGLQEGRSARQVQRLVSRRLTTSMRPCGSDERVRGSRRRLHHTCARIRRRCRRCVPAGFLAGSHAGGSRRALGKRPRIRAPHRCTDRERQDLAHPSAVAARRVSARTGSQRRNRQASVEENDPARETFVTLYRDASSISDRARRTRRSPIFVWTRSRR
jgi:hypothetical protein